MADQYITLPIETDPDELAEEGFLYLEDNIPGWTRAIAGIIYWLIGAVARIAAELRDVSADVPKAIFRYLGSSLHGIDPIDDVSATATLLVTVRDNAGYLLPELTQYALRLPDGTDAAFEQTEDVDVDPGDTTAIVTVVAIEAGDLANDSTDPVTLIDSIEYITTVAIDTAPTGGLTAETDDEYLDRLAVELELLSPRPVLAEDYAVLARRVSGVTRATAVNNYSPYHNLLTENQSGLETDLTGWVGAGTNCTATRQTSQGKDGVASLRLRAAAGADMRTTTSTGLSGVLVDQGVEYTASAFALADSGSGAVAEPAFVGIRWYDNAGVFISEDLGTPVNDELDNWDTEVFCTAVSPLTASYAAIVVGCNGVAAANDDHFFDDISMRVGSIYSGWVEGQVYPYLNEKSIAVAAIDDDGAPVAAGVKTDIAEYLEGFREDNFVVNVIDPGYTTIDVDFEITVLDDFDSADVLTAATDAVTSWLSPDQWGLPPEGTGQDLEWRNVDTVRYLALATILQNVDGVDTIVSLTLNADGESPATVDVQLAGLPAPLPEVGAITGVVS